MKKFFYIVTCVILLSITGCQRTAGERGNQVESTNNTKQVDIDGKLERLSKSFGITSCILFSGVVILALLCSFNLVRTSRNTVIEEVKRSKRIQTMIDDRIRNNQSYANQSNVNKKENEEKPLSSEHIAVITDNVIDVLMNRYPNFTEFLDGGMTTPAGGNIVVDPVVDGVTTKIEYKYASSAGDDKTFKIVQDDLFNNCVYIMECRNNTATFRVFSENTNVKNMVLAEVNYLGNASNLYGRGTVDVITEKCGEAEFQPNTGKWKIIKQAQVKLI